MTKVRETKRADELKPGDWTAPGGISALAAEVLHTLTYPHPGDGGMRTHLVLREFGITLPFSETYAADNPVGIATAEELESFRAGADRAQKIADIRSLADFLEQNPGVPAPDSVHAQASPGRHGDVWNSGLEGITEVRRVAEIFGEKVRQDDERTEVVKRFGGFDYTFIAWHKDGRPAEPLPTGAMTEQGLVDETPAEPVHMEFSTGESMCGLATVTPHRGSHVWREVTCQDCVKAGA